MAKSKQPKAPPPDELLQLRYVPLSEAARWDWSDNPKRHDKGAIWRSIEAHGFIDGPKFDAALQAFVYGNGRVAVLVEMQAAGQARPRGIGLDADTGEWLVPVKFGVDAASEREAKAAGVDHNNLTLSGGDLSGIDMAKLWDAQGYADLLADLAQHETLPVTVDGEDVDDLIGRLARDGAAGPSGGGYDSFEQTQHIVKGAKGADARPTFGVLVICDGEGEQAEMFERLRDEGYNVVMQGAKPPGVKR